MSGFDGPDFDRSHLSCDSPNVSLAASSNSDHDDVNYGGFSNAISAQRNESFYEENGPYDDDRPQTCQCGFCLKHNFLYRPVSPEYTPGILAVPTTRRLALNYDNLEATQPELIYHEDNNSFNNPYNLPSNNYRGVQMPLAEPIGQYPSQFLSSGDYGTQSYGTAKRSYGMMREGEMGDDVLLRYNSRYRSFEDGVRSHPAFDNRFGERFIRDEATPEKTNPTNTCGVCSASASGRHYSGITCEGCKGFFRRVVINNTRYTCKDGNMCDVNESNRRKCCKACRYVKCIAIGMDPNMCLKSKATSTSNDDSFENVESPDSKDSSGSGNDLITPKKEK